MRCSCADIDDSREEKKIGIYFLYFLFHHHFFISEAYKVFVFLVLIIENFHHFSDINRVCV
jgi:hypothetical protein